MIADPPSLPGAIHSRSMLPLTPGLLAVTPVGASGVVAGVIASEAEEGVLVPLTLLAVTEKV